ncbi:DNA cytosine methyltransferase [Acinetobacter baylyi]|uniref:DNA cytosine methyltransferase n=1 Tax=Acinetobacter baylyi TaxID=202950 RepID=UPI00286B7A34|nr:DNA cytosine methyltransferase [Acinetobacter baylyi]
MPKPLKFIDLFAGAGGLSEGFIRAGFEPIAHVEADASACFTLKTRQAFHWLNKNNKSNIYTDYLNNNITRDELYKAVPQNEINSVINKFIDKETLPEIFQELDNILNNEKIDLIIGGPPCQGLFAHWSCAWQHGQRCKESPLYLLCRISKTLFS